MYDMAYPNSEPGECGKCHGSGLYQWGACVNGRMTHSGPCWSCKGTGQQTDKDIKRNKTYNYHKLKTIGI